MFFYDCELSHLKHMFPVFRTASRKLFALLVNRSTPPDVHGVRKFGACVLLLLTVAKKSLLQYSAS